VVLAERPMAGFLGAFRMLVQAAFVATKLIRVALAALLLLSPVAAQAWWHGGSTSTVTPTDPTAGLLTTDRDAYANWKMAGLLSIGGIPNRTTQCGATLSPLGGGSDDTTQINSAINACSTGDYVNLGPGTFVIAEGHYALLNKSVTLRGAGAGVTILQRTPGQDSTSNVCNAPGNWGATIGSYCPGNNPTPVVVLGGGASTSSPISLATNGVQGSYSISVTSTTGISVGSLVNVDKLGYGQAMPSPDWTNAGVAQQVWASSDYDLMWNAHNPTINYFDSAECLFTSDNNFNCGSTDPTAYSIRAGGVQEEYHLVTAIGTPGGGAGGGTTITFDSPLTLSYPTASSAAVEVFTAGNIVQQAGLENLTVEYGDNNNVEFQGCLYCWVTGVESTLYLGHGFSLDQGAMRDQLENYWVHDGVWPVNGGAGYNIALTYGTSEDLIDNGISMRANKCIVMRASGSGVVVSYNYMDDQYISGNATWVETCLNESHLVGSHHALFEGNRTSNIDSDYTHGASPYGTYFRNDVTGIRETFTGYIDNITRNDAAGCCGPLRAASSHPYTYWTSFIGNILGLAGVTTASNGWDYQDNAYTTKHLLMLGWNDCDVNQSGTVCGPDNVANVIYPTDPRTVGTTGSYASSNGCMAGPSSCTTIVDGNYDYVTGTQQWSSNDTTHTLPNSFYLPQSSPPSYFSGYTWPPYNPAGPVIADIPAHLRWEACLPTPTAGCLFPQGPPVISGITLNGGTIGSYSTGVASGTVIGPIVVTMSNSSSFDGTLSLSGTYGADFSINSGNLVTNTPGSSTGQTPTCTVSTPLSLNIVATPGTGEGGSSFPQAVTVTCYPAPTISAVNLSNGTNFTTPAAAGSTIDTLSATCSVGTCAGATFALSTSSNAPGCTSATNNGNFAISGTNLNIGSSPISGSPTENIGIQVTLSGATNNLACYPKTLTGVPVATTAWNPSNINSEIGLTNNNLTATLTGAGNQNSAGYANVSHSTGRYAFAVTINAMPSSNLMLGLGTAAASTTAGYYLGNDTQSVGYAINTGAFYINGMSPYGDLQIASVGSKIWIAVDLTNHLMWEEISATPPGTSGWIGLSGGSGNPDTDTNGIPFSSISSSTVFPAFMLYGQNDQITADFTTASGLSTYSTW
jgi:hypothetical protein